MVDHLRTFVVDKHLEAESHKRNPEKIAVGKQQTLKTVLTCKMETLSLYAVKKKKHFNKLPAATLI